MELKMKKLLNKNLKRCLLILLALCFLFSFACANEIEPTPEPQEPPVVEKPEHFLIKVEDENSKLNIYNVDKAIKQEFLTNNQLTQISGMEGDYTGNAINLVVDGSGYLSSGYRIKAQIDMDEYSKLKKDYEYNYLYMWLCVTYTGAENIMLTNYQDSALIEGVRTIYKESSGDGYVQGKWFQVKFVLNSVLKYKLFNDDGSPKDLVLFRTEPSPYVIDRSAKLNIYIGDFGFC